jgi:exoribonuclease-2
MHLLFEEDGSFRSGSVLADNTTSLQVETASGKRTKIKRAQVLLEFGDPSPCELLPAAEALAAGIDASFLWECCGDGEFAFADLAADYYGHQPKAIEATAVLLALQAAPIHFHRKGKGRFRKAPPDILQAALAGQEKKRLQAETVERLAAQMVAGELPQEVGQAMPGILFRPDRNRLETKALEAACDSRGVTPARLLLDCGALRSPYAFHLGGFLFSTFPDGTDGDDDPVRLFEPDLPRAEAPAFSIDDAQTTEIDDAFSLQALPGIGWRVGVHIAAPALGFTPESQAGSLARERLSTVYMPGHKITMLPEAWIRACTLIEGREAPAVSLYLTVSEQFEILDHESRIERVAIAANLRLHELEPLFNEHTLTAGLADFRFARELETLWRLALACEARRGKPAAKQGLFDFNFRVEGDVSSPQADIDACRIHIEERRRGSPIDLLVSELMIVANATWGGLLDERRVAGLYRTQTSGKVRMSTQAGPHEGLGVPQYAWCTSPLRRYADLLNQWQLIACLREDNPPFANRSEALFGALRDFEAAYAGYAEFQRQIERFWCLRWLVQEGLVGETPLRATAMRREGQFRLDHLPLVINVPSAPALTPGTAVLLRIAGVDELALTVDARHVETLAELSGADDDAVEEVA